MDKKLYNTYLRMARIGCRCVVRDLARVNKLEDMSLIRVRVRDEAGLLRIVADVARGADIKDKRMDLTKVMVVNPARKLAHTLDWMQLFLQSVQRSADARVCQKRLLDLAAAETYLQAAYDYDVENRSTKAVTAAKKAVVAAHSERFIREFTPYGRPKVDPNVWQALRRRAYDPRYAFTDEKTVMGMAAARCKDFWMRRDDFFLSGNKSLEMQKMPHMAAVVNPKPVNPQPVPVGAIPVPMKTEAPGMDMTLFGQLYGDGFADMESIGRRRRFVNLGMKCRDVLDCPKRLLVTKRRFLEIESMTKHSYIVGHYDDGVRGTMDAKNVARHYLQKEAEMYQNIWHTDGTVEFDGRTFAFPDGKKVSVPQGSEAHVLLHSVNAIYASLFGYTQDDAQGGDKWLEDSVRAAYTDEGTADYRLAACNARLAGKMA